MAVYERRYQAYSGPETPGKWRWLIVTRYAARSVFASRIFVFFFGLSFLGPLVALGLIYLQTRSGDLGPLGEIVARMQIDRFAYRNLLVIQSGFAFLIALFVATGMLYDDLVGGGLPLYLARPINRTEYIAGKFLVPFALTSMVTWIPGLLLFGVQSALEEPGWTMQNLRVPWAILISAISFIVTLCLVGLACAAAVRSKVWSRAIFLIVYFVSTGAGQTVNGVFTTTWGSVLDLSALNRSIFAHLFGESDRAELPLLVAALGLAAFCSLCVAVLWKRVRPLEIVR